MGIQFGLGERIRTSGLLNPIQARYQTAPHPDIQLSAPLPNSGFFRARTLLYLHSIRLSSYQFIIFGLFPPHFSNILFSSHARQILNRLCLAINAEISAFTPSASSHRLIACAAAGTITSRLSARQASWFIRPMSVGTKRSLAP